MKFETRCTLVVGQIVGKNDEFSLANEIQIQTMR